MIVQGLKPPPHRFRRMVGTPPRSRKSHVWGMALRPATLLYSNKRIKAMLVQLLLKWNGYHFRTKAQ